MKTLIKPENGFDAYAWPGGYPIVYKTKCGMEICADCANQQYDTQTDIVSTFIHWEGKPLECGDCDKSIESAYGEPDKCENPGRFCKCTECQNTMADIAYDESRERE